MTLALSPSRPNLANLIVSDIAPIRSALSSSFERYLGAMARIADPLSDIKTREEADSVLRAEEKVDFPPPQMLLQPKQQMFQDLGVRQLLLTNLSVPSLQSNETVKFKIPVNILADALADIASFPYTPDGPRRWKGRTLVVKGAKSE